MIWGLISNNLELVELIVCLEGGLYRASHSLYTWNHIDSLPPA